MVSGTISLLLSRCFSPFLHSTRTLSVSLEYLALPDGPGGFAQNSSCSALLRIPLGRSRIRVRDFHPLWSAFPGNSTLRYRTTTWSYNPCEALPQRRFGLFPVRSPLLGESFIYFLFLRVLRCFSSPRWPLHKQMSCLQHDGLSHSEIGGSKVICTYPPLIAAYHVLHRLSEPRHPPSALIYFLTIVDRTNKYIRLSFAHTFSFLFVVRSLELLFYSLACVNMSKIFSGTCPGVENNGFEPLTPCLQSRCSSQLS